MSELFEVDATWLSWEELYEWREIAEMAPYFIATGPNGELRYLIDLVEEIIEEKMAQGC